MSKSTLILVGHFATGKSSVARRLAKMKRVLLVEIGDIVRDEAVKSGSRTVLEHAADTISSGDRLKFVEEALRRARSQGDEPYIIVGIRTTDELKYLRANLKTIVVLALVASESVRRTRWLTRDRVPEFDWEVRDSIERSWGLDDVIESADGVIDAHPALDVVVDRVDEQWSSLERAEADNSR